MAKLQAKKIAGAIQKAKGVGRVEEPFTVCGCSLVLRNLLPDEYADIGKSIEGLDEMGYLNAYRREHIARSVVELNGESLRDINFVEVDVEEVGEDNRPTGVVKSILVETHAFIRDYILVTWGREAIDVAFRKFNDVVEKADREASNGVVFTVPDETQEERYRRLLTEAKEVEGFVALELAAKIRDDAGFTLKPSVAEYEAADARLAKLAEEAAEELPQPAPQRQPLNRVAADVALPELPLSPVSMPPPRPTAPSIPPAAPARAPKVELPELAAARQAAETLRRRTELIEELEKSGTGDTLPGLQAVQVKDRPQRINPDEVQIDTMPVGGINPRFRPPPRV
jgi:hypothetical protein